MPIGSGAKGGIGVKATPGLRGPHRGLPWRSPQRSQLTPSSSHQYDAVYNILPTGFADSRATVATYFSAARTISTAAVNTARVERDEATAAILGLFVEPAATNIIPFSATFAISLPGWQVDAGGSTLTNTALSDPRGTKTAQTINLGTSSANAGGVYVNYNNTISVGSTYTWSAWVRSSATGGASFVRLSSNNASAWNTGISTRFALTSAWQRISVTGVIVTSGGGNCNIGFDNRDATGTYDSTCTGSLDVFGVQLELGSTATSYIETTSNTAVTRAADSISFTLGASQTSVQFTFDDGSTQTISGLTGGSTYTIPTNLNRSHILYIDDATAVSYVGAAAGTSTVTGVGAWLQSGDGLSSGANTATAVGAWLQSGVGSAAGANTTTATGTWLQSGVGSAAGSDTATGVSNVITWNSADKNSNISLSNNDLTATLSNAVVSVMARATVARASGYFETTYGTLVNVGGTVSGIGLANSSAPLNNFVGCDNNGIAYYANGNVVYGNALVTGGSGLATYAAGDVIGVELTTAPSVKFTKNGTLIFTYTGTMPTGSLFPAADFATQNDAVTANFGATAMSYLPVSVTSWDQSRTGTSNYVGSAAGSNTAAAVGAWLQSGVGSSAGTNTTSGVGSWLQSGVGSAAGANTASATSAPIQAKVGSAAGTDTATGVGAWLQSGVGSSSGSNTATATAAPIQAKVGSAAGTNTTTGVGAWLQSGVGSSAGTNTATATGAWLQAGVGSSAGSNTTTAVGSWLQSGVGNAAGANTTSGYSAAVPNVGTSAGANTSTAVGTGLQPGVGTSAGTDTATAVGAWLQSGVGSSAGTNTTAAVSNLAGVTWNPSDKSVDVTLSGGNLTATRSSTSTGVNDVQARANTGRTSGGYFELVFSTVVGGAHNPGIGLGNLSQSVNDYPGHTANSIGWFANGYFQGPTGVQSAPTFGVGDVIGCELTSSSAKFYKNGTLVATESSLPTGTLYPLISVASVNDAGTANFGATSMAYLPVGVVSWDGSRTGSVTNVGSAAGSNTSTAVGAWIKASVGSAVGGNVASAVSTQADFNNDYDQSFAGFPGAETGLGTGDFNNDFNNDYAVFHVGNIVSGVGASVGGNIAAAVSSTEVYVPPVTPPPPTVAPQVWHPAREYTRVQAPRAVRTYRTGTELKRSTPQGMKRRYG